MSSLAFDGTDDHTPVGYFTYTVDDDHWAWSAGLYALHGYTPHQLEATTELMLSHKHPDDTVRTLDVLETVIRDAAPFSCYHRIVDTRARVRYVLSVGRGLLGTDGRVEQVTGFFIDLTDVRRAETQREVDAALVEIARTRSVIDQAKGMVMVAVGCDADEAFDILRTSSSRLNIKLNQLCVRVVEGTTRPTSPENGAGLVDVLNRLLGSELPELGAAASTT